MIMRKIGSQLLSLLFPPTCVCCDRILGLSEKPRGLCEKCLFEWLSCRQISVRRVKKSFISGVVLYVCEYDKDKKSVAHDMVLKLKSHQRSDLADFMAREVAAAVSSKFDFSTDTSDIIFTCVPRSKQGLIENGFDQAEIVGIKLAEYLGFPYVNLLKNKSEKVQKHLFSEQREKNAETAYYFIEKRKSLVKGKKIFLYDDVVTTGATMMNCVKILLEAGGSEVYCVSFASSVFSKK